jgi:signal transduction histidine kinase
MARRHWPTVLALLAAAALGWHLLYTELLIREVRRDAAVHSQIYVQILRGLQDPDEETAVQTLLDLSGEMQRLGIPIVVSDADGVPAFAVNLPFRVEPHRLAEDRRMRGYLDNLRRDNPVVEEPGLGTIYFGDPPLIRRLRWVPWIQLGALGGVLLAAGWIVRHNLRVERERIWATLARESAHQMATPLSSLSGWVEILRLHPEERERLAPLPTVVEEIDADLARLETVSRRFEGIGRPIRRDPVDLPALLSGLERYVRARLPRLGRGVELEVRVAGALPPVAGNAVLLEWALENLVKNALDALAGTGGQIIVEATADHEGRAVIRVCDDGPGIPPNVRRRLYEPGVSTKTGGWGIGLSVTRRIVEEVHGGRLVLEPSPRGTRFAIHLPRVVPGDGA